ncbi:hypothetical protein SAMN05421736_102358 [Evansella caseinilytica]|uniref:Uncharacterized protein n=1 Tax=Evansella caseinilytica TaxID=1503961 RepID=A0A1H3L4C0_9BACI|nr:hypothetical protein [Evansella caseinilytica]SDY59357.1 hypothetical protein SAMN05421736_102358 [Evansella caseinilytica]
MLSRDGTWIDISEILAEEETMSEADAFFQPGCEWFSRSQDDDIPQLLTGRE